MGAILFLIVIYTETNLGCPSGWDIRYSPRMAGGNLRILLTYHLKLTLSLLRQYNFNLIKICCCVDDIFKCRIV